MPGLRWIHGSACRWRAARDSCGRTVGDHRGARFRRARHGRGPDARRRRLLALALVLTVPILVLAGRRRGVLLTATVLGAGQWVMHQAFVLLAAPVCTTAVVGSGGSAGSTAGHLGHGAHLAHGGAAMLPAMCAGAPHTDLHAGHVDSFTMVALHVVATGLTAAVVASGERAASRLGAWLARVVRFPAVTASSPCSPARLVAVSWSTSRPALVLGRRCTPLRGPPVAL